MISIVKNFWTRIVYQYILPLLGLFFLKLISLTYKLKIIDSSQKIEFKNNKKTFIYASWHQRFLPAIMFFSKIFSKKPPIAAIVSKSKDGEIISQIAKVLGWHPVRGSSSIGGSKAMEDIISLGRLRYSIGHAVDGPQGPFGMVKPGIIRIAQLTQISIVPMIISSNKYWTFNSWDHFMLPKPFSKVTIDFATPYIVPRYMNKKEFEKRRLYLETTMAKLYENANSSL